MTGTGSGENNFETTGSPLAIRMRLIPHIALTIWLLFLPSPAWARLRALGGIKTVGLVSENPLDVTIVLDWCEWDGVASSDGGRTWRVLPPRVDQKTQPPKVLYPLPVEGLIRYQLVEKRRDFYSGQLFLSEDAGATWSDVSPWRFLSEEISRDVAEEKQLFLRVYGQWLPQDKAWPWAFGATAVAFLGIGGWRCRKLRGQCRKPVTRSAIAYVLTGLALFFLHRLLIGWLCTGQWNTRHVYWTLGITYPRWPLGVFGHLTGNAWMAPLMAAAFFPSTALCARILFAPASAGRAWFRALAATVTYGGLLTLLILLRTRDIDSGRSIEMLIGVNGRTIRATIDGRAFIEPNGDAAVATIGAHKIVIERERVTIDGVELLKLRPSIDYVEIYLNSQGYFAMNADRGVVATQQFPSASASANPFQKRQIGGATRLDGRVVHYSVFGNSAISPEGDAAVITTDAHKIVVERERVTMDGAEVVRVSPTAKEIRVTLTEDRRFNVEDDGHTVISKQFSK